MNWNRETEGWFFPIVVGLALVLVVALHISMSWRAISDAHPSSAMVTSEPASESSRPKTQRKLTTVQGSTLQSIASVFECHEGGRIIFSDQRCGTDAHVRNVQAPNSMQIQPIYEVVEPPTNYARPRDPDYQATRQVDNKRVVCGQIEAGKREIDARMRKGYSAAEGELLREKRRRLSDEYYDLRCHHFQ